MKGSYLGVPKGMLKAFRSFGKKTEQKKIFEYISLISFGRRFVVTKIKVQKKELTEDL